MNKKRCTRRDATAEGAQPCREKSGLYAEGSAYGEYNRSSGIHNKCRLRMPGERTFSKDNPILLKLPSATSTPWCVLQAVHYAAGRADSEQHNVARVPHWLTTLVEENRSLVIACMFLAARTASSAESVPYTGTSNIQCAGIADACRLPAERKVTIFPRASGKCNAQVESRGCEIVFG